MNAAWWARRDARWIALLAAFLTWMVLQGVRTRFFLTDDSFTLFFPVWVDFGRKWFEGGNPWVCEWLFGGGYPLMQDSVFLPLLHPFFLVVSLLAVTPLQSWMMDVVCLLNLLLAVWGFEEMLDRLRDRGWARVGRGAGLFLGWSYAFSMYALLLGSSGFWYLANLSALPWLVAAILDRRSLRAVVILALAVLHGLVGGYPSCFLYSMVTVGLLASWLAWHERDGRTFLRNLAGFALGGALGLPFVWTPLWALGESVRSGGIPVDLAGEGRLPWEVALGSVFFSSGSMLLGTYELFGQAAHAYALVSFAGAGLFAVGWIRPRRDWCAWDGFLLAGILGTLLLVTRPDWLGRCIAHIPIFGSLRWPHKEVFLLVFFLHLFAARGSAVPVKGVRLLGFASVLVFVSPLVLVGPPSFNEHSLSRQMYLEGKASRMAEAIRVRMAPGQRVVLSLPDAYPDCAPVHARVPWIFLMSHNFPALWKIPCWSGYSATLPRRVFERNPGMASVYGNIRHSDEAQITPSSGIIALHWDPVAPFELGLRQPQLEASVIRWDSRGDLVIESQSGQ